jgi:16S rRNA (uracil1498-N3)-methyltransferase
MSTFYAPSLQSGQSHYQLSEEESKHCVKVLRMQVGASIELINGKGLQAFTILEEAHPKRSLLRIEASIFHEKTPSLHIAMAPTKNMDRIEWYLEKATELGLSKLTFLLCEHSERKQVNTERLEKIAIAAMKQSKRFYLPELEGPIRFDDFLQSHPKGYFGHCEEGEKIGMNGLNSTVPFLIGPEGDFSPTEIAAALQLGYQAVEMSAFRLRTETAALLATTALLAQ